jgi:hypothetical protein
MRSTRFAFGLLLLVRATGVIFAQNPAMVSRSLLAHALQHSVSP